MSNLRSITDEEIALIKAMLSRGMKGKDIQFFFNRPDRAVNSGRITGIKKGTYSNSNQIERASENDLDEFLDNFKAEGISASVIVPHSQTAAITDHAPMSDASLKGLFAEEPDGSHIFRYSESEQHEAKQDFGFKHAGKWLRAIAALANNSGSYIVFGVTEKQGNRASAVKHQVTGLNSKDFEAADPADFTKLIKSTFDPTPRVEPRVFDIGTKRVGVMYVHKHDARPIIAQRGNGDQVKEGDIFFRYPGQSSRIKYSDLRTILDERDQKTREQILPMMERLLALGPKRAMVADLTSGEISDGKNTIVISGDLLEQINFIREGEFNEKQGAPTLRLVGDVKSIEDLTTIVEDKFVTSQDLLTKFLEQTPVTNPKEYIRCAVEGGSGGNWLPIFFFADLASLTSVELVKLIEQTKGADKRKTHYAKRAEGKTTAFRRGGGVPAQFKDLLEKRTLPKLESARDASIAGQAVSMIDTKLEFSLIDLLDWLASALSIATKDGNKNAVSNIRRGLARVDEVYFSK